MPLPSPYAAGAGWRLYQGDSLALLRELPQRHYGAVITDPPYSSGGAFRGDRAAPALTKYCSADSATAADLGGFSGDNRDQRSYLLWSGLWLSAALAASRPGAAVAVWTDWRQLPVTTDALQVGGWTWRGVAQWVKTAPRPQKGRFAAAAEYVVWGSAGSMGDGSGVCAPGAVWAEPVITESVVPFTDRQHITEKPLPVMDWCLSIVQPDSEVLDPFTGSGSTGVAALRAGLRFVGIEQEATHLERAAERLRAAEMAGRQVGLPLREARAEQLGLL